jgi:hypothetical protein
MADNIPGPGSGQGGQGGPPPPPPEYAPTQTYDPRAQQQYPQAPPAPQAAPQQAPQPAPPQTPPAAYPPPPNGGYAGYGHPQQGYPQQGGYPPPAYPPQQGYPQQGGYPPAPDLAGMPTAPAAPRKKVSGGLIAGILAIVVVAAAGIVGATMSSGGSSGSSSGSGGSGGPSLTAAWSVTDAAQSGNDQLLGGWTTSSLVVRGGNTGVSAYRIANGAKAWTLTPPAGASVPCSMSPTISSGGVGTIAFGTSVGLCSVLAGVDTATGSILWTVPLTNSHFTFASEAKTYIQGSVATVLSNGVFGGVDVSTGKSVWSYTDRGQFCNDSVYGTTGVVLISDFCADASPSYTLSALDAETGKVEWRKPETGHVDFDSVISGDPLVAVVSGTSGSGTAYAYDSSGNAVQLAIPDADTMVSDPFSEADPSQVVGRTLIVQSSDRAGGSDSTGGTVGAYSLTTGSQLWTYSGESKNGAELVGPSANGAVYALSTGSYDGEPHYVRLDPAKGTSTILGALGGVSGWGFSTDILIPGPGTSLIALGDMGNDVQLYR